MGKRVCFGGQIPRLSLAFSLFFDGKGGKEEGEREFRWPFRNSCCLFSKLLHYLRGEGGGKKKGGKRRGGRDRGRVRRLGKLRPRFFFLIYLSKLDRGGGGGVRERIRREQSVTLDFFGLP